MLAFNELRSQFQDFHFHSYQALPISNDLVLQFTYEIKGLSIFQHTLTVKNQSFSNLTAEQRCAFIFQIGVMEIINYWKTCCCPRIRIHCGVLSEEQISFFKKVFYEGLGEFRFLNQISSDENWLDIKCDEEYEQDLCTMQHEFVENKVLVPVGGGKDSAVVLDLLKAGGFEIVPFLLNRDQSSLQVLKSFGFSEQEIQVVERVFDPKLLELNQSGYLNGHVPFSAILGFISLLVAGGHQCQYIALANESSASEGNAMYLGKEVNHQYSKSYEYELLFRKYTRSYLSNSIEYFSLLRPFHEIQIAKYFSGLPFCFSSFRSCNRGQKINQWCCHCSKCLFVWVLLSPFLSEDELTRIFGKNLWEIKNLLPMLEELGGWSGHKPFECVGTYSEVRYALFCVLQQESLWQKHKPLGAFLNGLKKDLVAIQFPLHIEEIQLPAIFKTLLNRHAKRFDIHS